LLYHIARTASLPASQHDAVICLTYQMKLRQLAVFLGGYMATIIVLARLYHSFSGTASPAIVATCIAIALLIGFGAGTSETAARHAATFVLASFCGALTVLLSFCLGRAGVAFTALPYVFFWTNAAAVGMQAARMCRTALSTAAAQ
jgi:hypothetical protein